ncbi:hypothetical protein WA158_000578 [Blastocystis sp. Blastoise]
MNKILCCLLLFCVPILADCASGEYQFYFSKYYGYFPSQETFELYEGSREEGTKLMSVTGVTDDSKNTVKYDVCLKNTEYTLVLLDESGDGWGSYGQTAILTLFFEDFDFFWTTIPYQSGVIYKESIVYFHPHFTSISNTWKYSDNPQTTDTWRYSVFSDSQWLTAEAGSFPVYTQVTRYYRNTVFIPDDRKIYSINLNIKTVFAMVIYLDGKEVYRYRLPSGQLTPSTPALSLIDGVAPYENIRIPTNLVSSGTSIQIAIEMHQLQAITMNDDMNIFITFSYMEENTCTNDLFINGIPTCSKPDFSTGYACDKPFDKVRTTSYYTNQGAPVDVIYTFNNGKSVFANKYGIRTGGTATYGDPKEWMVYGSNNQGNSWTLLDHQKDISFNNRYQLKYFYLNSNRQSYNQYKLSVVSSTMSTKIHVGEFSIYDCNIPFLEEGLHYERSIYTTYLDTAPFDIRPLSSGFSNYTISPDLPTGILLDSTTGHINGISSENHNQAYTINAINPVTNTISSTTLTLIVNVCNTETHELIILLKYSTTTAEDEYFTLKNSLNETIYTGDDFKLSSNNKVTLCVSQGIHTFDLYDIAENGWSAKSYLLIQAKEGGHTYDLGKVSLLQYNHIQYKINFGYLLKASSTTWKYYQGSIPTSWYSMDISSWSSFTSTNTLPSTSSIWLFRNTFIISSKQGYSGLLIRLKRKAGYIIYVNNREYYRYKLGDGELTMSTVPEESDTSIEWTSVTMPLSYTINGSNTIAIAIVNQDIGTIIDFDCSIRLLALSKDTSRVLSFIATTTATGTSNPQNLFDFTHINTYNPRVYGREEISVDVTFSKNQAEYINKYCLSSSNTIREYDPSDWAIYGSNDKIQYTLLANETNVIYTKNIQRQCFYIPTITKPYTTYRLLLSEPREVSGSTYYYIGEWELLLEDLDQIIIPPFSITPNHITTIAGSPFPSFSESNDIYRDYRIEPSLPSPLELDTTNGNIRGTPISAFDNKYTLFAKDHLNKEYKTDLFITVTTCNEPNILISLFFSSDSNGDERGFEFRDSFHELIEVRSRLLKNEEMWFHYCKPIGVYSLLLKDSNNDGWGSGYVNIYTDLDTLVKQETLKMDEIQKTIIVNIGYLIKPNSHIWNYMINPIGIPSTWYTEYYDTSKWNSAQSSLIPLVSISNELPKTQVIYMKTSVNIDENYLNKMNSVDISIKTRYGCIIYLNGQLLRTIRLDPSKETNEIEYNTPASSCPMKSVYTSSTFSALHNGFIVGKNIIAIELHNCEQTITKDSFNFYIQGIEGTNSRLGGRDFEIIGDVELDNSYYPVKYLFDNNQNTVHVSGPRCAGAIYGILFNNEKMEYINSYNITTYVDCNPRHPSAWRIEGSNDLNHWTLLDTQTNQILYTTPSTIMYTFYNDKSYRAYRLVATECNNQMINPRYEYSMCQSHPMWMEDEYGFSLAEILFQVTSVEGGCKREDGFTGAINDGYGTRKCDRFYSGILRRKCSSGKYGPIINQCTPAAPEGIEFDKKFYSYSVNKQVDIHPNVLAVDYSCIIEPSLPEGLYFDNTTASVTGIVNSISDMNTFMITCSNSGGKISQELVITITKGNDIPLLEYVITGFFILVALCILIIIVVRRSSVKKASKKKILDKKPVKSNKSTI